MATRGRKSENTVEMSVENIRFSQPTIDTKFRDKRTLKETLEEILKNPEQMVREVIPAIKVYWSPTGYYAIASGNRRLYLFKLLSGQDVIKTVPVIIKQKSKSTSEAQKTYCAQEPILKEIIEQHIAANPKVPEKPDENKAEPSATTSSQSKKDQTPLRRSSRKAFGNLTNNVPVESSKLLKSADKVQKHKPQAKEDGMENSTSDLKKGLRKRKSDTKPEMLFHTENPSTSNSFLHQDPPEDKESPKRCEEPTGIKETFRSLNKSSEGEDEDSPKRPRLTPSPDSSPGTELTSAATGNSQDMADLSLDIN